jgi:DNA-binding response OmpR family regulator
MASPLILIAEDEPFLLKVYKAKMEKAGIRALLAQDGEQVFELLNQAEQELPQLILLDIIMPKKDGFTVLKELKAHPKWANIPVMVTSNLGQPEDKVKAIDLGALDYIVKSDTPIQGIIEKVQNILQTHGQAAST